MQSPLWVRQERNGLKAAWFLIGCVALGGPLAPPGQTLVPQMGRHSLCEQLVSGTLAFEAPHVTCFSQTQKKPAILYSFLLETMTYAKSNFSRIRIASCNLAGE